MGGNGILLYTHPLILSELSSLNSMDKQLIQLAGRLGEALKVNKLKIATAESCTGGLISALITEIPGSSAWFDRGFVTYSNQAKADMLKVNPETLAQFGAVSAETAEAMAEGALHNSQADWSIAVTGIAGPDGGTAEKPVGTVFLAWHKKNGACRVQKECFSGLRNNIREQTAKTALETLLKLL